jgi:hypothetical protein
MASQVFVWSGKQASSEYAEEINGLKHRLWLIVAPGVQPPMQVQLRELEILQKFTEFAHDALVQPVIVLIFCPFAHEMNRDRKPLLKTGQTGLSSFVGSGGN